MPEDKPAIVITLEEIEAKRNSAARYYYLKESHLREIIEEEKIKGGDWRLLEVKLEELKKNLAKLDNERDDLVTKIIDFETHLFNLNPDKFKKPSSAEYAKASSLNFGDPLIRESLQSQLTFYQEVFNLTPEVSNLKLPEKQTGFDWLLLVPKGLTPNQVLAKCKERFVNKVSYCHDLDAAMTGGQSFDARDPNQDGTYAIYLRNRVEADKELQNLSADDLKAKNKNCITLLERLLLELWYHWQNKKHLDLTNCTLCAGSRSRDGNVPGVDWSDGELCVSWDHASDRNPFLRARAAVS